MWSEARCRQSIIDRASFVPKVEPTEVSDLAGPAGCQPGRRPRNNLATRDVNNELDAIGHEAYQCHRRPRRIDRAPVPERQTSRGTDDRLAIPDTPQAVLPCMSLFCLWAPVGQVATDDHHDSVNRPTRRYKLQGEHRRIT